MTIFHAAKSTPNASADDWLLLVAVLFSLVLVFGMIVQTVFGKDDMATEKKELTRMSYQGFDVTVLKKGMRKSQIRDQYGYVKEVSNKELKKIDDPARATVTVPSDNESF